MVLLPEALVMEDPVPFFKTSCRFGKMFSCLFFLSPLRLLLLVVFFYAPFIFLSLFIFSFLSSPHNSLSPSSSLILISHLPYFPSSWLPCPTLSTSPSRPSNVRGAFPGYPLSSLPACDCNSLSLTHTLSLNRGRAINRL